MNKRTVILAMAAVIAVLNPLKLLAAEARLAIAANFAAPMKLLAEDFERQSGHRLTLVFGATGQLYTQIRNGAPFAALLSADDEIPDKLMKEGLAVPGSSFTYATGRLVLWSRQAALVDAQGEVLRKGSFDRIAMANPKLAPYGAAALEVLDKLGLRERIASKVVEGANITQTFQFVSSGNAALGFIALSQVFEHGKVKEGSAWVVPTSLHAPLRQNAVLLNPGRDHAAAGAFLKYLRSDRAQAVIRSFGYEIQP